MSKKLDVQQSITPTSEAPYVSKPLKEAAKEKLEKFIKEETVKVKGIFQNFENPGGMQAVNVRKYPGIPPFRMEMQDGMEYEIPLYVARHLNGIDVTAAAIGGKINTCAYPVHGFQMKGGELAPSVLGSVGKEAVGIPVPIVGVNKWKRRFGFQSLEFAGSVA